MILHNTLFRILFITSSIIIARVVKNVLYNTKTSIRDRKTEYSLHSLHSIETASKSCFAILYLLQIICFIPYRYFTLNSKLQLQTKQTLQSSLNNSSKITAAVFHFNCVWKWEGKWRMSPLDRTKFFIDSIKTTALAYPRHRVSA